MGAVAGANTLTATAAALPAVTFTATSVAGTGQRLLLTTAPPASVQSGVVFATRPSIQLGDSNNNPVALAGVTVTVFIQSGDDTRKVLYILGDRLESFITSEGEVGNAYRELSMPKPHYAAACEEFGLTLDDYIKWLQAVFLMINADFDGRPMIDKTIENILKTSIGRARIYRYSDTDSESVCLLSDRGLNDLSPNAVPGPGLIWDFNLTSKAFIRIWLKTFTTLGEIDRGGRCGWVELDVEYDNLDRLANYDQNAVYQCAQKVYCSGQVPYGIVVER